MRKGLILVLIAACAFVFTSGFASVPKESAPKTETTTVPVAQVVPKGSAPAYLIDNFEDGDADKAPEWFNFDNDILKVEKTTKLYKGDVEIAEAVGTYALSVDGNTNRWYVGGMGTMIGLDASQYDALEVDVYGNGENSGRIKVELYDDDNNNKEIEVDSSWVPTSDDQWSYAVDVNWTGWKHIKIPFPSFTLANAGKGNGKFDPDQTAGSAGLIKLQLIFVANAEKGEIGYSVDNLELTSN